MKELPDDAIASAGRRREASGEARRRRLGEIKRGEGSSAIGEFSRKRKEKEREGISDLWDPQ